MKTLEFSKEYESGKESLKIKADAEQVTISGTTLPEYLDEKHKGFDEADQQLTKSLNAHTSDTGNPHKVTKSQVGLSNADNTSDKDKPVSTAVQTELDKKIDTAGTALTKTGTTLAHNNHGTAGTYRSVTINAQGHVTAGTNPTTIAGYGITDAYTKAETDTKVSAVSSDLDTHKKDAVSHITAAERSAWNDADSKKHEHSNKTTIDKLAETHLTKLAGIDEGANKYVHPDSGVSAGTYRSVTVNKEGHITSGSNPTTVAGYSISDAYTKDEVDNKFSAMETNIDWKESVATYADILTTYPKPDDGWTVNVKDTDYTYRWTGSAWVAISANAIPIATEEIDGKMSSEHVEDLIDATSKKHTHANKSVLDKITQTMLDAWDKITDHIADAVSHITSTERTNWNDANTKKHEHANKATIDKLTEANLTKLSGIAENANNYVHPDSGVTAGTYRSVTVSKEGHVTAGTNPTTLSGYGITNAYTKTETDNQVSAVAGDLDTHTKDAVAHIAAAERTNWNDANTKKHTHGNKAVLDEITKEMIAEWTSGGETSHSHANKATLDNLTAAHLTKLNGIAENANNYVHPSTAGNKHVPSGGSSGQILKWSAAGTATWGEEEKGATPTTTTPKAAGTAAAGSETAYARGDHVHPVQTTITGNAGSATKLQTARKINNQSFDGTADVNINHLKPIEITTPTDLNDLIYPTYLNGVWFSATEGNTQNNISNCPTTVSFKFWLDMVYQNSAGTIHYQRQRILDNLKREYERWNTVTATVNTWTEWVLLSTAGVPATAGKTTSADKLTTARTIALTGDAAGSVSFDGSANASIPLTLSNSGITAGSYGPTAAASPAAGGSFNVPQITLDAKGRATSAVNRAITLPAAYSHPSFTAATAGETANKTLAYGGTFTVPQVGRDTNGHASTLTARTMTLPAAPTSVSGNAGSATKLQTARTFSLTGDATGSVSFDGSANASIPLSLANSGVTAGAYGPTAAASPAAGTSFNVPQVTVDAKGRTTAVANRAITLPAAYSHPTFTAATAGESANKTLTYGGTFTVPQVGRDANGHASTVTARTMTMPAAPTSVSGNAGTATKLQTARTISLTGDAAGSVSFDGSENVTGTLTMANSGVSSGAYGPTAAASPGAGGSFNVPQITVDAKGRATAVTNRAITLPAAQTTITGNAGSATKLQTARTISLTGDATGSVSFDGSSNATGSLTLANSGVTAGSYGPSAAASPGAGGSFNVPQVTVDAKGRTTAVANRAISLPAAPTLSSLGAAPISHAMNSDIYGIGEADIFGHVRVLDDWAVFHPGEARGQAAGSALLNNFIKYTSTGPGNNTPQGYIRLGNYMAVIIDTVTITVSNASTPASVNVTWSAPFSDLPFVVAQPVTSAPTIRHASASNISQTGCTLHAGGAAANIIVRYLAIGPI